MSVSIQDVAKAAGVSISTVSRSLTHPDLVSSRTREKVLRIAEELNFSLSRSATALKSGRSLRVAMLMSDHIRRWFSASVIEGLNQVFHQHGYDLSIFQISSVEERHEFFTMLPVRRNADAVIVVSLDIDKQEISRLAKVDVPIIGINSVLPPNHYGFAGAINIDDHLGATLLARHLITLGHRDIAYIRANRKISLHFSVDNRFESFMACCRNEGIEPHVIAIGDDDHRITEAVAKLMMLPQMPTAIACQEDGIALPMIFLLQRNGFNIPSDISLVGYDDSFYAADAALTTIRQDPIAMAKITAQLTLDLINGKEPVERFITIRPQLILRASTARPQQSDND